MIFNLNQLDAVPPKILFTILQLLDIDIGDFMYKLFNDEPREVMLYAWLCVLYNSHPKTEY